jgi:uncharacterized membrane protein
MNALARLPAAQGISAMQSINVVVINPLFMTSFLGTAAACVFPAVSWVLRWREPGAAYLLAGSLLYLVGVILAPMPQVSRSRYAKPFDQLITRSLPLIT